MTAPPLTHDQMKALSFLSERDPQTSCDVGIHVLGKFLDPTHRRRLMYRMMLALQISGLVIRYDHVRGDKWLRTPAGTAALNAAKLQSSKKPKTPAA